MGIVSFIFDLVGWTGVLLAVVSIGLSMWTMRNPVTITMALACAALATWVGWLNVENTRFQEEIQRAQQSLDDMTAKHDALRDEFVKYQGDSQRKERLAEEDFNRKKGEMHAQFKALDDASTARVAAADARAARADAAAAGLRVAAARAEQRACEADRQAGALAAAAHGREADLAGGQLFPDVLGRCGEALVGMARAADDARARGAICERAYSIAEQVTAAPVEGL